MGFFDIYRMKVIVISLEGALERQKYMTEVLDKQDMRFQFFKALSPSDISQKLIENKPRHLSKEAVATFETHRKVLEYIRDSGEITLVLEDDATPNYYNVKSKIESFLKTELEWDVMFIGWTPKSVVYKKTINDDFLEIRKFIGMHSYIPNPKSIDKILSLIDGPTEHIDKKFSILGSLNQLKNIFTKNKLFYQNTIKFKTQIPKSKYT
jgi:GR25 family glycosyltransferase involved in LPS biosynthesis